MDIIYGINPVAEALKTESCRILKIAISREAGREPLQAILALAAQKKIPVAFQEKRDVERLAGHRSHQGIVGLCKPFVYANLDQIIADRPQAFRCHLLLLLDGVTDPQNLGALIRTAHCFGVNGVVIPEHRSASVNAAVVKASAGAVLYTPVARVMNLARTLSDLKEKGFWIYGADADSGQNVNSLDYHGDVGLVMGSEGEGLRSIVRKRCDFLLSIPMRGKIDSLNVSVAAGIILNDINNKWANGGGAE
jgi:23S rRNA (guanosine2251-2'-O)-methyltransferase